MALCVQGQLIAVPCESKLSEEQVKSLFARLCGNFKLDDAIGKFLVENEKLECMDDFVHFFTNEQAPTRGCAQSGTGRAFRVSTLRRQDIEKRVILKIENLVNPNVQASRLRRAWAAARQAASIADTRKKRGLEDEDLDALLPSAALADIGTAFYTRYHMQFDAKLEPSDHLVSALFKQLLKRLLQVRASPPPGANGAGAVCGRSNPCGGSRR